MWREDSESEWVKSLQDRAEKKKGTYTGQVDRGKLKRKEGHEKTGQSRKTGVERRAGKIKQDEQAGEKERTRNRRKMSRP